MSGITFKNDSMDGQIVGHHLYGFFVVTKLPTSSAFPAD
jgi:hypothetical protein